MTHDHDAARAGVSHDSDGAVYHKRATLKIHLTECCMSTTTIRLTKELKDKVVRAAERAGKTSHAFILEAIAEKAELEERRSDFIEDAEQRYARIAASGKTVPWSEMRQYLERRVSRVRAVRP